MNGKCSKCSKWPSGEPPYQPRKWSEKGNNVLGSHNCYSYMLNDLFPGARIRWKPQPGWFYKIKTGDRFYDGISKLNCRQALDGVRRDNPDALKILSLEKGRHYVPRPKHYKGILVVSPDRDYHFARQDNRLLKVYSHIMKDGLDRLNGAALQKVVIDYSKKYMLEIYKYMPKKLTKKEKLRFLYNNSKTWSHKPGSTAVSDKDGDGRLIFDPLKASWDFSKSGGINYSKKCCFFSIPMNTHKETFSTGSTMMPLGFGVKLPTMKARTNISASLKQQIFDKKIRQLIK